MSESIYISLPTKSHCLAEQAIAPNILTVKINLINSGYILKYFVSCSDFLYIYILLNTSPNSGMSVFAEVLDRLRFLYENTYDIFHCLMFYADRIILEAFFSVGQLLPETLKEQTPGFQVTEVWNSRIAQTAFVHFLGCLKSPGP